VPLDPAYKAGLAQHIPVIIGLDRQYGLPVGQFIGIPLRVVREYVQKKRPAA
jgi:hypothetical protein